MVYFFQKLTVYLIFTTPLVGICWFFFSNFGETGVIFSIIANMLIVHAFLTEEHEDSYEFQKRLLMRYRHFKKLSGD